MISSMIVHPERFLTLFAPARISSKSHQDQARQNAKHTLESIGSPPSYFYRISFLIYF